MDQQKQVILEIQKGLAVRYNQVLNDDEKAIMAEGINTPFGQVMLKLLGPLAAPIDAEQTEQEQPTNEPAPVDPMQEQMAALQ